MSGSSKLAYSEKPLRKVVHLTSAHPPFDIRIFVKECVSLANNEYDTYLVVPHSLNEVVQKVNIVAIPICRGRLCRMLVTGFRAYVAAKKLSASVWHIHDPELLIWSPLARLSGVTVIYDMHENTPKAIQNKEWLPCSSRKVITFAYRLIERLFLWGIPVVFAEKSYRKDYVWVKRSWTVLNFPVVNDLISIHGIKSNIPSIGYFGCVAELRGSVCTLNALRILKANGIILHWHCIGDADEAHAAMLIKMAEGFDVGSNVTFHGYRRPHDGWRILAECHIGLAVLQPIPNYYESYPTKMFEYMALGLPVIASDFPLYRDVIEANNCGICVDPTKPEELADAIRYLIENPMVGMKMGANGRQAVHREFSWKIAEAELLSMYATLPFDQTIHTLL